MVIFLAFYNISYILISTFTKNYGIKCYIIVVQVIYNTSSVFKGNVNLISSSEYVKVIL